MKAPDEYVDILEPRRASSDLKWAARVWQPITSNVLPHNANASSVQTSVLHSTKLRHVIHQMCEEGNVDPSELYKQVQDMLYEMGYNKEMSVIRILGLFTSKLLKRLCNSIYVNQNALLKVKSVIERNPVLFVPTHRSYADFILMSYICFHYDIDIPCVAAGMDFHGMVFMGEMLRNTGAFFMRRTFSNDKLYSVTFAEYVQTLIAEGGAAVEFFIEGTRSRTSKSLMPKFGFLSMALKPFLTGQVPDISVVPINISYDRCLEENLFAYEVLGIPKPRESTRGFMKAVSILKENYGNVFVNFGEPVSVKKLLEDRVDRSVHSYGPVILQEYTPEESKEIQFLAHVVINRQRELTVLTCFNVIVAVFINHLWSTNILCSLEYLIKEVQWLTLVLRSLGACVKINAENVRQDVLNSLELHRNLFRLSGKNIVLNSSRKHGKIDPSVRLRGHELQPKTMDSSVPLIMLQHYVNPMLFCIVSCSSHILALSSILKPKVTKRTLFGEYRFFHQLFSHEFVFYDPFTELDFENSIAHCLSLGVIIQSGDEFTLGVNEKLQSFCKNILSSFIPGYVALSHALLLDISFRNESDILKNAQALVEERLFEGKVTHPANLSLDSLSNGLQALTAMGIVTRRKSGNSCLEYKANPSTLRHTLDKLVQWNSLLSKESLIFSDSSRQFSKL